MFGPVNVSGSAPWEDMEAIRQLAQQAMDIANAAAEAVAKSTGTISVVPTQSGSLTYNGEAQSPSWNGYDSETLTIGGTTSGTDAGTYTATFTPREGFAWPDGTTTAKSVTWTIKRASLAVPSQSGTLTYTGSSQTPSWSGYDANKLTMGGVTSGTNAGTYTATFIPKANYQWSDGTTTAKTVTWTIGNGAGSLSLNKTSAAMSVGGTQTIVVTRAGDGAISATSSDTSVATVSVSGNNVVVTAVKEGSAVITVEVAVGTNYNAPANKTCAVTVTAAVYGASWDGTSTTKWTRTDAAAGFTDPVPYVAGASNYGSPFDNIQPWAGMVKSERTGGTMVAIPKFYYKLTQDGAGMKVQITTSPTSGYSVSPAHMDRGDGKGERDVVYVGRYHCGVTAYKSASGQQPKAGILRSEARTAIHNLGENIWQMDFAMWFTICLLYIVEFADWNSQKCIGYGCGNNSGTEIMGYTNSMPYHTGTTQTSRTKYGLGTQYRNIEGLWDNVADWIDGCYYYLSLYIIMNPSNFNDRNGGTSVGTPSHGYPSAFSVKTNGGFPLFIPTEANGSEDSYSCDVWGYIDPSPCLMVGGFYGQDGCNGLFCVSCNAANYGPPMAGCRIQELPDEV